ncbi:MAG: pseudouridine synthase, partial [Verrucomicrobia bacterium]|nr:pseudouridine synthase [Verrucomicrobiota bacterium]
MQVRLQKFLAEAGVASRRAGERLIVNGLVEVNGKIVKELGTK